MARRVIDGKSTEPDLIALVAAFGIPAEGQQLAYQVVAGVIGQAPTSTRWKTVTTRWRRVLLRDHNVLLRCVDQSFVAADPVGFVAQVVTHTKRASKQTARALTVGIKTNRARLDESRRGVLDHEMHRAAKHQEFDRQERRKKLPPAVAPVQPRLVEA